MKTKTTCLSFLFLFLFASTVFAALNDGLVAYYPFNGNANDESGNGNHGTVYGATLTTDRYGTANSAYSFDGTDYIRTSIANSIGNEALTAAAWVKFNSIDNTEDQILYIRGTIGNPYTRYLYLSSYCLNGADPDNCIHFGTINTNGSWGRGMVTDRVFEAGKWYHLVSIADTINGVIKIYLDGDLFYSIAIQTGDIPGTSYEIWMGSSPESYQWMNGTIDDVRIYNRALSDAEIHELYLGVNTPELEVISPNGGEVLQKGHTYTINWNSQNITENIQINLYKENTNILQLTSSAPNTGRYFFNLPVSLVDGNDYRIHISTIDGSISDFSDYSFSIISYIGPDLWPTKHHDYKHTGQAFNSGPSQPNVKFIYHVNEPLVASPIIDRSGTAYISGSKNIYAVNKNGALIWNYYIYEGITGTPTLDSLNNVIYIPANKVLYSLTLTGVFNWKLNLPSTVGNTAFYNGNIYFVSNNSLLSVDMNGNINWQVQPAGICAMYGVPSITSNNRIIIPGNRMGTYYCQYSSMLGFDLSGNLLWEKYISDREISSATVSLSDTLYFGYWGFSGVMGYGDFYAVNSMNGNTLWRNGFQALTSFPSLYNNELLVVGGRWGEIQAFNPNNGSYKWG